MLLLCVQVNGNLFYFFPKHVLSGLVINRIYISIKANNVNIAYCTKCDIVSYSEKKRNMNKI